MIVALCCTHGRYSKLRRSLRCFLDQDYEGDALMFIVNSGEPFLSCGGSSFVVFDVSEPDSRESEVSPGIEEKEVTIEDDKISKNILKDYPNRRVVIWNMPKDCYKSVGEKYTLALDYLLTKMSSNWRDKLDIITSWDDDDVYLPNHLTEGLKGMRKAYEQNMLAYKPQFSYFRYLDEKGQVKIKRDGNSFEPSIFVDAKYLEEAGYAPVNIKYHQQWLDPLIASNRILVDPEGVGTFVYNWGDGDIWKMSGSGDDGPLNLMAHKAHSVDMGEGVLIPNQSNQSYYDEIKNIK